MKSLLLSVLLIISFFLNAQQNFFTVGYGLNIADNDIILERGHYIVTNDLVLKASYAKEITDFIRGKVDIAYADYVVTNFFLTPLEPDFVEKPYQRLSLSIGPVFKLYSINRFTFLSGFNAGYHIGSDHTVSGVNNNFASYFDYAINPLRICYQFKGFTIDLDTYIGSNMYSNVFIGVGYAF